MILNIYCIFDSKVSAYGQPFYLRSKGEAVRGFSEVCNDSSTNFNKFPGDYSLYELGTYDDTCAKFEMYLNPLFVGHATEFLRV